MTGELNIKDYLSVEPVEVRRSEYFRDQCPGIKDENTHNRRMAMIHMQSDLRDMVERRSHMAPGHIVLMYEELIGSMDRIIKAEAEIYGA